MKRFFMVGLLGMVATTVNAADIKVSDAWARASAPGQDSGMVQLVITSKKDAKLVAASCQDATTTEIHNMSVENGMMKMRQVESVNLPAGKTVDLGESGHHLMLLGLKRPLAEGKKTRCALVVRGADGKEKKVKVEVRVKPMVESVSTSHEHMHHH